MERAALCPYTEARPLCGRHKLREGMGHLSLRGGREYLQQGMAVVDGAMAFVKPSALADEVSELRALVAEARPVDLGY